MKRYIITLFTILFFASLISCDSGGGGESGPGTDIQTGSITGIVDIPGMDSRSGCVVTAELVVDGTTAAVYNMIQNAAEYPNISRNTGSSSFSVLTDDEGNYSLTDLPEGNYTLTYNKENTLGGIRQNVYVTAASTVTVDIVLTATGTISGTVDLNHAGADLRGSFVYTAGSSYVAGTDATGFFTISNVPIGTYTVIVYHEGYGVYEEINVTVDAATDTPLGTVTLDYQGYQPIINSVTTLPFNTTSGETVDLAVSAYDPDNDPLTITWSCSDGTFIDSDGDDGQWTAPITEYGVYTIEVTVTDGIYTVTGQTVVQVGEYIYVTGVSLDKTETTIVAGFTEQLTATIEPGNAVNQNVTWSSDNTGVATVSPTGLVTAVSAGMATITVTTLDGSKSATCLIDVHQWSHPATLSDYISPAGSAVPMNSYPKVAMDNNGNTIIVWHQEDGSVYSNLFMSEYRNGTWTHPASLSDFINPNGNNTHYYPQVAMDNNGNAIIVWSQDDESGDHQIFMSEYRNGAWNHPATVSNHISVNGGNGAVYPQVAMDDNGNAIIVWFQYDESTMSKIFMSEYRNGSWSHPTSFNDNINPDGYPADYPKLAMDNNGNAVIVWSQRDPDDLSIFMSEYRNGTWTHPASLSDSISPDGYWAAFPNVSMDNNENAIIVWFQHNGSDYDRLLMSEYRGGSWIHPSSINDKISPDGGTFGLVGEEKAPSIAMDDNGNAVIAWMQRDEATNRYKVLMSEYRGGAWIHPATINDNINPEESNSYPLPKTAMDNNGNAVIVWIQFNDTTRYRVFMSKYRNGIWIHPATLSDNISPECNFAGYPEIAMGDNGNVAFVWKSANDSGIAQIFMSELR